MEELLDLSSRHSCPRWSGRYPMTAVREAHQDILWRRTTGKVLDPSR